MKKPKPPKAEHEHDAHKCQDCTVLWNDGYGTKSEILGIEISRLNKQITDWQKRCGEAEAQLKNQEEISTRYMKAFEERGIDLIQKQNKIVTLESDIGALKQAKQPLTSKRSFWLGAFSVLLGLSIGHFTYSLYSQPKPDKGFNVAFTDGKGFNVAFTDGKVFIEHKGNACTYIDPLFTECHEYALQEKETIKLLKYRLKEAGRE